LTAGEKAETTESPAKPLEAKQITWRRGNLLPFSAPEVLLL
jgi:hypothetical protein